MQITSNNNTWKYIFSGLFVSCLFFFACTQGQGPGSREGEGTGAETIRGGTETLTGAGSCDTPENANNVLCQWVATELIGKQGDITIRKVLITYYDTGWPKEITDIDQHGNKKSITQIYYDNNLFLERTVAQESPDPVGTDNFTRAVTKITEYHPNGSIDRITTEKKDNTGTQLFRTTEATYSYPTNSQMDVDTKIMDDPGVVTSKSHSTTLKDPSSGKINSIETKAESSNGSGGFILETWYLDSYTYDPNGRIDKLTKSKQECSSSLISGGCQTSIQATERKTYDYDYDGQGRVSQLKVSSDGDSYNPSVGVPDNQIESFLSFTMNYDPALPGKIARQHPLEILLTVDLESPLGQGFNDRDLFSSFSGQMTGAGIPANYPTLTMTIKWARLWEVLPGGKAPGS